MRKNVIVVGVLALIVIGIGFWLSGQEATAPEAQKLADPGKLIRSDSRMTKTASAKVNIVEFGDFQCPACGALYPVMKKVLEDYKDKDVNFVYRHFPLSQIHQNAELSAMAAEAAGAQGKFWEMYSKIFETQTDWENNSKAADIFAGYAQELGLNVDQFKEDIRTKKYLGFIKNDYQDGIALGVDSTPTVYINEEKLQGLPNVDTLKKKIDDILNKQ